MSKDNQQKTNQERRFSQEQYDMLKRCSEKKDMTEWNEYRKNNPAVPILLEGADLRGFNLEKGNFDIAQLKGANLTQATLGNATLRNSCLNNTVLEGCNFYKADLSNARLIDAQITMGWLPECNLFGAHLENANLTFANLNKANLSAAIFEGAKCFSANLQEANFFNAILKNAIFRETNLEKANLYSANLQGADFSKSRLEYACLLNAKLQGTNFSLAIVDGFSIFIDCEIDRYTNFSLVGLDSSRIEQGTKQLLNYNIRRMNWDEWYKAHMLLKWPAMIFWWISDYGRSTWRIIGNFFFLAVLFATIYYACGAIDYYKHSDIDYPGIVNSLFVGKEGPVPDWLVPFRAIYFSIVTMTTLGFGDMHANSQSFWGHLLLTIQVLLGYILLAALVTRFAILFTAGGPAGKFSKSSNVKSETHKAVVNDKNNPTKKKKSD